MVLLDAIHRASPEKQDALLNRVAQRSSVVLSLKHRLYSSFHSHMGERYQVMRWVSNYYREIIKNTLRWIERENLLEYVPVVDTLIDEEGNTKNEDITPSILADLFFPPYEIMLYDHELKARLAQISCNPTKQQEIRLLGQSLQQLVKDDDF